MKATNHKNLSVKAYERIKEMILDGTLKQGEAISINAMADILQISRTPITNACQHLEFEKFLTIVPKQGVIINTVSIEAARDIYELRAAIESYNAKRAFDNMDESDIDVLRDSVRKQEKDVENGDVLTFMKEDTFFHRYILGKYNNYEFLTLIGTLYDRAFLLGIRNSKSARLKQSIADHKQIIAALESGDKQGFANAIENNILNGYRSLTSNYLE